jgi:hypothetical protein
MASQVAKIIKMEVAEPFKLVVAEPFSKAESYTDVVFVVEEKKINFTKVLLIMCSPVFDRMFNGDFTEASKQEIPLAGKKHEDFVVFLQLIHPATAHSTEVTGQYMVSVLVQVLFLESM